MKRIIKILLMFFLSCTIAYLIGQKIVVPLTSKEVKTTATTDSYDLLVHFEDGSIENYQKTDDNPWNKNIGKIEDDEIGDSILMTPETSVAFTYTVGENAALNCEYMIHPWMQEVSDGADFSFYITDKDDGKLYIEKNVSVSKEDGHKTISISLADCAGKDVDIKIVAGDGGKDNSAGDWIVFTKLEIE